MGAYMSLRTIMIFPEFSNIDIINEIRNTYDPLAHLVRPHITLVFPFEHPMSNSNLAEILEKHLGTIKPFGLQLQGISKSEDPFGNYLFLNVKKGKEQLYNLLQIFYVNEFREFDMRLLYTPHMTIGKLNSVSLLNDAYAKLQSMNEIFETTVNKISVEMIGANEESIIIMEKYLHE